MQARRSHLRGLLVGVPVFFTFGVATQTAQAQFQYIEHRFSGKFVCSEQGNGTIVHLWGPMPVGVGHEPRYKFKLVPSGDKDYYYLFHQFSGLWVCSEQGNGTPVHLWGPIPQGHEDRYKFKLVKQEKGQYYMIHKFSGKYLCSEGNNGNPIHLWGPIPDGHQARYEFTFKKVGDTKFDE